MRVAALATPLLVLGLLHLLHQIEVWTQGPAPRKDRDHP